MQTSHSNPLVSEFLQRPSRSTLAQFAKSDLVDLAVHLGWSGEKGVPKKAKLRVVVEGLAVSAALLEVAQAPGVGEGGWTFEQCLQLEREKAKLERERFQFELEQEKLRADTALAKERVKVERLRLQLGDGSERPTGPRQGFDVSEGLRLLPKFDEKDPDTFFALFERVAGVRGWSDAHQTLMLQCVFTGKAQRAFSALSSVDSASYAKVKAAVLKAYELVPEAYRQRFRNWERRDQQSHVEFVQDISMHFSRWCSASSVESFDDLCDLVVLEQFKMSLPAQLATYVTEKKVKTAAAAAVLADEYVLTHGGGNRGQGDAACGEGRGEALPSSKSLSAGAADPVQWDQGRSGKLDPALVCNYCFDKGHWKKECPVLRRRGWSGYSTTKPSAVAVTVGVQERASAIAAVRAHTNPSTHTDGIDPGYLPFVSDGFVSLVGHEDRVPVKVLRDTGALDSFIVGSLLPFSAKTHSGSNVKVRGMGLTVFSAPRHRLMLFSELVQGEVVMVVRPVLPMEGVHVILGNDLAGARGWPGSPAQCQRPRRT